MKKVKLFFGSWSHGRQNADVAANEWLEQNPDIRIVDIKYQQARFGDHSICILYEVMR